MVVSDCHRKDLLTFRQKIEEIVEDIFARGYTNEPIDLVKEVDRICTEIEKLAEAMPKTQCVCQSWIREQIKEVGK